MHGFTSQELPRIFNRNFDKEGRTELVGSAGQHAQPRHEEQRFGGCVYFCPSVHLNRPLVAKERGLAMKLRIGEKMVGQKKGNSLGLTITGAAT